MTIAFSAMVMMLLVLLMVVYPELSNFRIQA